MHDSLERRRWKPGRADDPDASGNDEEAAFRPLTREEARALRERQPQISPWRVVAVQAAVGTLVALIAWMWSGRPSVGWSALYGTIVVVLPTAVLARGMGRLSGAGPVVGAAGFLIWEGVKVLLAVVLLLSAWRVVPDLSWPALLAAMVVCLKVNWVALLWQGRPKNVEDAARR